MKANYIFASYNPRKKEDIQTDVLDDELHNLVVWNDDVNTFDWVIESLIDICHHSPEQAEQCTLQIHYKGKCAVKKDTFNTLRTMCEALIDRGINATVE